MRVVADQVRLPLHAAGIDVAPAAARRLAITTMSLLRSMPVIQAASPRAAPKLGVGVPSRVAHSPTKIFGPLRSVLS